MKGNILFTALSLSLFNMEALAKEPAPIEPIMVTIPAGNFEMGDRANQKKKPLQHVSVEAFSLGMHEVTVREFRHFIEATDYVMPNTCYQDITNGWFKREASQGSWQNNALNTSEYQPVNCINFSAIEAYIEWLSAETGKPYRLPTEAEWEYAARAGTTEKYYFGNDPDQTNACEYENIADLTGENIHQRDSGASFVNYRNAGGKSNCIDHAGYASIVGMYKANPFGLHDMMGNVMEYTSECFVGELPMGGMATAEKCEYRSLRGSDWHRNTKAISWRPMRMTNFEPGGLEGFRLALDGPQQNVTESTQVFKRDLKQAQQFERQRRDSLTPYPETVKNVTLNQVDGLVVLNWDKSLQKGIESYRIYRNERPGTRFRLIASNIVANQFKDANADFHQYEYSVVAVRNKQQGDYSAVVTTDAGMKVSIPGRVEAETAFVMNGKTIRLKRTSDTDIGYNVTGRGGIPASATLEYVLDVEKSDNYILSYRVTSPRDTKGFTILINDKEVTTSKITKTGGWNNWQTQTGNDVYLKSGKNTMTVKSLDNNWKLNWLEFKLK